MPLFSLLLLALPLAAQQPARVQPVPHPVAPAPFFGTYSYLSYTILDRESSSEPIPAQGVGGTLTLRSDGSYQKRLTLTANGGPMRFDQDGRYTFTPGRIRFTHTDKKGQPRTDEGTFRLDKGQLTIVVAGFPVGNQSTYTLRRQ
ncbi:hypothetical protein [Hymenobacter lapidiphilus]|uniref:Lipocalin-like domain-containing protein n=1 Tax=Hymenobacter lapidiphilus TaxID=2608003 RepID=A0A7Y7PR48_9BACT|nr:hypothetical protein [Hymenobacter lapidiphilus]NVO32177.1 hypothetical protein [Hymenobacter lapidiphilus]